MNENRFRTPDAESNGHGSLLENPMVAAASAARGPEAPAASTSNKPAPAGAADRDVPAPDGAGLASPGLGSPGLGSPGLGNGAGAASAPSDRDAAGKFAKGNRVGPGNPFTREVNQLRRAAVCEMSEADMRGLVRAMIELGKKGDCTAARLAFQYTVGKPAPPTNPDREDIEEWLQMQETKNWVDAMPALIGQPKAIYPLTIARTMQEELTKREATQMGDLLSMAPKAADSILREAHQQPHGWLDNELAKRRLQTGAQKKTPPGKKKRR